MIFSEKPATVRDQALGQLHRSMIVAVIAMRVMQTAIDKIIDMITMGNRLMAATGAVLMRAFEVGRAAFGIGGADRNRVFVHAIAGHVVQMAIMQVVDVAFVAHRCVAAIRTMSVRVILVLSCSGHVAPPRASRSTEAADTGSCGFVSRNGRE
jgi:hypothetical protein